MDALSCPYCGVILDKAPRRSKTCDECGHTYHYRKTNLFKTKILTTYQSDSADFFDGLKSFGATIDDYISTGKDLEVRWKRVPTYSEVLWTLSNSGLVERGMKPFSKQESIRITDKAQELSMAQANYHRKLGNDPRLILAIVNSYDIQREKLLRESDDLYFEIRVEDCCIECQELNGCVFSAGDIEDNEYIPSKLCTHKLHPDDKYSWCTCKYLVVS